MISNRRSARRLLSSFALLAALFAALILPASAQEGGPKIFSRQTALGGRVQAALLIVGWQKDASAIERLIDIVAERTGAVASQLDWQNPGSDVGRINAAAGQSAVAVSEDTIAAFEEAKQVSDWTKGLFDVASYGQGSYKDIKIDRGARTVQLKKSGMQVRFDGILEGFLAEYMLRLIAAANMQNAMVKAGNVFRGMGSSVMGPWKIQVQDSEGTYAHHALNLQVSNNAVATVSANEFAYQELVNPRNKERIGAPCKGVTIVMHNAAQAQGVAKAVFIAGPKDGMELLAKMGKANGIIVDNAGKFLRTPGF
ncbi:MAG: FAD:protein FMN transferase [Proteobacteria bacterium]|nr:FAD:protein FMN transferase [Pseudomonadota bacterium]